MSGLCGQCDRNIYLDGPGTQKMGSDFILNPEHRRAVYCYGCGPIRVDAIGECITDCDFHHADGALRRFIRSWFGR